MSLFGSFEKTITVPGTDKTVVIRRLAKGLLKKINKVNTEAGDEGLSADTLILTEGVVSWSAKPPVNAESFDLLDPIENRFIVQSILSFSTLESEQKKADGPAPSARRRGAVS
jgi:hypothetical protein